MGNLVCDQGRNISLMEEWVMWGNDLGEEMVHAEIQFMQRSGTLSSSLHMI
jgi:hypothetical protein